MMARYFPTVDETGRPVPAVVRQWLTDAFVAQTEAAQFVRDETATALADQEFVSSAGLLTETVAAASYARSAIATHAAIKSEVRRSKGGRIGTGGKPVIAIRVDHGVDDFLSTFWPLLKARGLPCGLGVLPRAMGNPSDAYEPTSTTWAELHAAHLEGFEIWSHSWDHQDPDGPGAPLTQQLVESKETIEANGFRVQGFQMPGVVNGQYPHYSPNWDPDTSWQSEVGQLLLANYGLIEVNGIIGGADRSLPTDGIYDLGHHTLDGMDLATATGLVDRAVNRGLSAEFMFHPRFINEGTVDHTLTDLTAFLDYLVTLRDAGTIEVLTPSGLAFADDDASKRMDVLYANGFEGLSAFSSSSSPWNWGGGTGPVEVGTDGGHTGQNYAHFPAAASYTYLQQGMQVDRVGLSGTTMVVEAWARAEVAATEARITVLDSSTPSRLTEEFYQSLPAGGGWTKLRHIFTVPSDTVLLSVRLGRRAGSGDIDFDDVHCYPI